MSQQLAHELAARGIPVANDTISLSSDLIWGVEEIAKFLGKTKRQTFHLVETKQIPSAKIGGRVVASREKLRAHFERLLNGEAL